MMKEKEYWLVEYHSNWHLMGDCKIAPISPTSPVLPEEWDMQLIGTCINSSLTFARGETIALNAVVGI